ncbi:MAG: aldehyde dehydrogenase family protein [Candidatus Hermodarchaeota archaeon]
MKFFGSLIKGKINDSGDKRSFFPHLEKGIQNPAALIAYGLKDRSSSVKFLLKNFTSRVPEKTPEIRLVKDHIKHHGYPQVSKEELIDLDFAEFIISGVKETSIACQEAARIKKDMHKVFDDEKTGLSYDQRKDIILKLHDNMSRHYPIFKEIGIAEGTPLKLFDWQFWNVTNALTKELAEFIGDRLAPKEIWCSKEGERTILHRHPFGAVGVFPPYNAALGLGFLAIFSSFIAGNATVTRAPTRVPLTNIELAYLLKDTVEELDFPISAFQAIIGPGRPISHYMVNESPLNAMVYYGDSDVGLKLMSRAVSRGMHFVPELAGSGASLVWKDVDIDKVSDFITHARFFGSGQICLAAKRLFLHEAIYDDFLTALVEKAEKLRPGLPSNPKTDLPLIGTRALYQIIDMAKEALIKGAKLLCGGYRMNYTGEEDKAGLFYKPTVLSEVDLGCKMWYHETFGPLLPVMKIQSFDQAIKQANNSPYGLRTSVYSDDPAIWKRFFSEIEAPGVAINTDHLHFDHFFPHLGGLKTSGVFGGKYFYEVLTYLKYRHFSA